MSGPRLSIIPAGAIFDRSLEPRDLHVLNLLGCHTDKESGWCRRSQVKMAAQLDCSRSSVQRSLDRLCEAGWVQKKRPPWSNTDAQPSHSYMYRVILDRDDEPQSAVSQDEADSESDQSYASDASETDPPEGDGCPRVGTRAQPDGHPGAQPGWAPGAHPYVGTKNVSLERPPIERERDARARERTAKFLAAFELRWPTAAQDDRQRTAYAAEALSEEDQDAALAGIALFLEDHKRRKRKVYPAGSKYLEQRRWELLGKADAAEGPPVSHPADSPEGRAIIALFGTAGLDALLRATILRHGVLYCRIPITPRLLAFGELPPRDRWREITRQQAGAWDAFFRETLPTIASRPQVREGVRMPHEFPPRVEGTWSPPTGPPIQLSEDDLADFR